ncbi:uncharacterized protein LOC132925583 [Rhopalosiphum padi]|uniref:uncharacterized protein LOC132925583 n=1 Tax=Rhopalosiphum padi TaxID=40932 RepID=UPI00298E1344|nr:uncharacterized protein LOC132925583 [Rhopalosiphum padi]
MESVNEVGKKKASGSKNRKRAKENAQKNALLVSKMPKLQNYFFKLETGGYQKIIYRSIRQKKRAVFFDEGGSEDIMFSEKENMKIKTFFPIIDALISNLNKRKEAYNELNEKFGFFLHLEDIDQTELKLRAEKLVNIYEDDLDIEFVEELLQFKQMVLCMPESQKNSFHALLKALIKYNISSTFPSIEIALKIFTCMPCSNASGERSFSVLKRVKTYLRSSLANEKTSSLSLLCMESKVVKNIDWSTLVKRFAKDKARKKL